MSAMRVVIYIFYILIVAGIAYTRYEVNQSDPVLAEVVGERQSLQLEINAIKQQSQSGW